MPNPRPDLPKFLDLDACRFDALAVWLAQEANIEEKYEPWINGFSSALDEYDTKKKWPGSVNDHCRWYLHVHRIIAETPSLESVMASHVHSLYSLIQEYWYRFVPPDYDIRIDPPELLSATVLRLELRTALRLARKFGHTDLTAPAFFYVDGGKLHIEIGDYRTALDCPDYWDGCVSVRARLLTDFWNSLPKGKESVIQYEKGWLSISGLKLGRANWQPKQDEDRMQR